MSHTACLQELHKLLAACYKLEEMDHSVLRCVLVAILAGLRKVADAKDTLSNTCPENLRHDLEIRLGSSFWKDPVSYQNEAMRVVSIFGQAKKMVEYMT